MLKSIIRTLLQKFIDDIDSDNCNITMEQQSKIISVLSNIANPDQRMSKIQACDYLGVSRATFDNYVSSIKFFRAIQKYGWENFTHEILYENLNKEAANKIERDLIRKYDSINNGYNIQEGGYTSLTQNSLDKMSKSLKQGYLDHPERRQKISEKLIGRKNSEETKRKKSLNSAKAKLITIDGEIGSIRFWALKIGMSHTTLNYRLKTHGEDNLIQFIKSKLK